MCSLKCCLHFLSGSVCAAARRGGTVPFLFLSLFFARRGWKLRLSEPWAAGSFWSGEKIYSLPPFSPSLSPSLYFSLSTASPVAPVVVALRLLDLILIQLSAPEKVEDEADQACWWSAAGRGGEIEGEKEEME